MISRSSHCRIGMQRNSHPPDGAGGIAGVCRGEITRMAIADFDELTQFEVEARKGRAEALYNLGLAYSTGQGVRVDYIAAHKWFNLAAMKGVNEARKWRAQISAEMSADEIAEAQRQARKWLAA